MSAHPASYALDGHAAGDHDPEVAAHMATCEVCRSYVERSIAAARDAPASAALARVLAAQVAAPPRKARIVRIAYALAPLAAAAVLVLLLRHPAPTPPATSSSSPSVAGSVQFKGGLQIAIVRERGTDQERFASVVAVRPGDRFRVEVSLDRERPVTAGVLASDGSWLTVLAPALLTSGTHLSERAAAVDDHPIDGVVIAGAPADVERARATRDFTGVTVLAIHPER